MPFEVVPESFAASEKSEYPPLDDVKERENHETDENNSKQFR